MDGPPLDMDEPPPDVDSALDRAGRRVARDGAGRHTISGGTGRRVAVVGAGAVGLTAAYDLAVSGADVTVYERSEIGGGSTGRAAGILYDAFAGDVDARVADRAIERFRAFSGLGAFEFRETPYLWFVTEPGENADAIREQVEHMRGHDRRVDRVDAETLADRHPALRTDDVVEAAVAHDAGVVDTAAYTDLLAALARDEGAEIREHTPATVTTDPPRVNGDIYDAVVVAAGAHTKQVLADAGFDVALKPYRVQALTADSPGESPSPDGLPIFYDATAGYYARPHPTGLLAGDGTQPVEADPDEYDRDGDDWFVDATRDRLADRIPGYDPDVERAWAGLCAATPDRDPLLGELDAGVYVAAGWQGHGFMRAPATGEAIAARVLGGDGIPAFDPTRFTGDEEFDIVEGMAVE